MNVIHISQYRDGGSLHIITDKDIYVQDKRQFSGTFDKFFIGYPNKDKSNLIDDFILEHNIQEAIQRFKESEQL